MITIFIAKRENGEKFIYSIIVMKAFAPYASTRTILLCSLWKGSANEIRETKSWHFAHKKWIHVLPFMKRNQRIICTVKNCYIDGSSVKTFRWI